MKRAFSLYVSAAILMLALTELGFAQQSKIPEQTWHKAQEKGVVLVIVTLNVTEQLEGNLSPQARDAQRQAIASAQNALIAELAGTKHRVLGKGRVGNFLGLEVGVDALWVLERSNLVTSVKEAEWYKLALSESVPLVEAPQAWDAGFDGSGGEINNSMSDTDFGTATMKKTWLLPIATVLWVSSQGIAIAQQPTVPKISPKAWQQLQEKGVARVIVVLNVPWQPEPQLAAPDRVAQRTAIAAGQKSLLAELAGTKHKVLMEAKSTPTIGIEVDFAALLVLEHSAHVKSVNADAQLKRFLSESVPLIEGTEQNEHHQSQIPMTESYSDDDSWTPIDKKFLTPFHHLSVCALPQVIPAKTLKDDPRLGCFICN